MDLGATREIDSLTLTWDRPYARVYEIQVSTDAQHWSSVYRQVQGQGGKENLHFPACQARYLRLYCRERATDWGYSLADLKVHFPRTDGLPWPPAVKAFTLQNNDMRLASDFAVDGDPGTRWASKYSDPHRCIAPRARPRNSEGSTRRSCTCPAIATPELIPEGLTAIR